MIILATGATGFIGKHVVNKLLAENFDVYYLSRNNGQKERCFQANIFDKDAIEAVIKKIKPDILVHFAWEVEHGKYWDNPDNKIYKDASINLFLTFLHYGGKKIIGAGSCAEYCTSVKPTIENTIINNSALSLYGQAKREVYEWLEQNVEDFIWLRIFGVYGKGEDQRRILPYLTYCVKNNIVPNIQKKNFYTDYVYVNDIAFFIAKMIVYKQSIGPINIGTGEAISNQEIYKRLCKFKGYHISSGEKDVSPSLDSRIPDCTKLTNLGFFFKLESGFREYLL